MSLLDTGEITIEGRMPWSSNQTFLAVCAADGCSLPAVYKPQRGERPLWDFPDGLYRREVAAFALSSALDWGLVPETVTRQDGPFGPGSLQLFVEADFEQHYFTLLEDSANHEALRRLATFDVVANNADRKSGHCLLGVDGHIWGIDNALCFSAEPKLRTVIWDFAGEPVPPDLLTDVARIARQLPATLSGLLHPRECEALQARAAALVKLRRLPEARADYRHYPWPLV